MRWSIPTLIQQLVDQGVTPARAGAIVAATYPSTEGDTFFSKQFNDVPYDNVVGVYAILNHLRANQAPLGGVKASDDARTIAQFGRLNGWKLEELVWMGGPRDNAIQTVVDRTVIAIRQGDYFEPRTVDGPDSWDSLISEIKSHGMASDSIGDYIRSIPLPHFGE